MDRGSLPPLEDDFARALLGSAEADAPSHAAYAKAAATLGLGVGASLSAAPAVMAVGAAATTGMARWSSTLGAKLALLGVSGALCAGAGALLVRNSEPVGIVTQAKPASAGQAGPKASTPAAAAAETVAGEPQPLARSVGASVSHPLGGQAAPKPSAPSELAPRSAPRSLASAPAAPLAARRVAHSSPSRASSSSSLAEQVQSLDRARVALGSGDAASALREIARYRSAWPEGVFLTEASVLEIEALAARGERGLAATRAAAFVAAHPDSPQAGRLRALIPTQKR